MLQHTVKSVQNVNVQKNEMSGEKLSFCVLKDDGNNEMSGEKIS